jgi:hypothetical protein
MGIVGIGNANLLSIVESCDWLAATTRTTTNASTTSSSNYYDDSRGVIICYNVSFGFSGLLLTPSDDLFHLAFIGMKAQVKSSNNINYSGGACCVWCFVETQQEEEEAAAETTTSGKRSWCFVETQQQESATTTTSGKTGTTAGTIYQNYYNNETGGGHGDVGEIKSSYVTDGKFRVYFLASRQQK